MSRRLCALIVTLAGAAGVVVPQTSAEDDVLLRAMRDELERSRQLRVVGGQDLPYFFSYSLTDSDSFRVAATMGAPVNAGHTRFRAPTVEVRVGNYDFDNTGHIFSGLYTGSRYDLDTWPLDDHYEMFRQCLWLATDRAYKTALESMSRKRAALNNVAATSEKLADFSPADPVKSIAQVTRKKIDEAAWTSRVLKLSSVFNAYPEVLASEVEFQAIDGVTYLVNSEGEAIRYGDSLAWLYAKAEGQAPDGMPLRGAASFQALGLEKLAPETEIRRAFTDLAETIRALAHAPAGAAFSGPTLFEPQAAAQLFAQLLGDNLRVPRKPLAEPGRPVNFVASEFETKIGSRILPDWMDVTDDPTQASWRGKALAGYYTFDLEGVPPKAARAVEKGILKSFVTTRQPTKGFASSNGHARLPGRYGAHLAAIGNLFVNTSQAMPLADLKKRLVEMCRERGKPYGMLVRKLDYPFSAGPSELQTLASSGAQSGGSVRPVSPPILVYRVYEDGREELVRGLRFRGVSTRSLRDIVAASQETALFDFVNNAALLAMPGMGGFLAPSAIVAPALLFDEIEFELPQDQLPKLPVVPPPNAAR